MLNLKNNCLVLVPAAVLVTILAIYLTPLKHLNLISPTLHEIDPKAAYDAYAAHPGTYMLIDVRSAASYTAAHVPGSINISIADLTTRHAELPKSGKQLVLICGDGRLATAAYGYLENWGFLNLLHLTGGLQNWTLEGLPVEGTNIPQGVTAGNKPS